MNNFSSSSKKRTDYFLMVVLFTFLVPLTLFVFRQYDDNRLTSWNWAFSGIEISTVFLILVPGVIIAYILSRLSFPERHPVIFLLIFSYLAGIIFWSEPEVIVDSSRYFTQAKHLKMFGIKYFIHEWGKDINAWTDLPLLPFIYGVILKLFGENRIYIQIFTTFIFSMTVLHTYLIGKTLWNESVGFSAGLLLLGMPYLLTQVPLLLVDTSTMLFLIFAVYAFVTALNKGGIWILISSIAVFLAFFSKYSSWLMLSVLVIIFLVFMIGKTEHKTAESNKRPLYVYRCCLVTLLSALWIAIPAIYKIGVIENQISILLTFQKPALRRWGESFISTFLYQIHPFISVLAIYSIYAAVKKRDLKYAIIFWLIFLMFYLWVKRIRYILPTFPMLAIMASYGLQEMRDIKLRRFVVYCAALSSLIIATFIYLPYLHNMSSVNLMNAGRYLNSLDAGDVEVVTLPSRNYTINSAVSVPILDIFTNKEIHYEYYKSPLPEKVLVSPLRFTWEYKNPDYYGKRYRSGVVPKEKPLVIITSEHEEELPGHIKERLDAYVKIAEFKETTGFFRYSPDVIIYQLNK